MRRDDGSPLKREHLRWGFDCDCGIEGCGWYEPVTDAELAELGYVRHPICGECGHSAVTRNATTACGECDGWKMFRPERGTPGTELTHPDGVIRLIARHHNGWDVTTPGIADFLDDDHLREYPCPSCGGTGKQQCAAQDCEGGWIVTDTPTPGDRYPCPSCRTNRTESKKA